jgi:hypothetical protein
MQLAHIGHTVKAVLILLNDSALGPKSSLEDDDCLNAHFLHTSLLDFGRAYCSAFFFAPFANARDWRKRV